MSNDINQSEMFERFISALENRRPFSETLWSSDQIAQWLGLSKVTVEMRVVTRPGFPAAFRPVNSKQAQRRWFANEVLEWARSNRGVIPAGKPGRRRRAT
jgi:hypothetical protein